MKRLAAVVSTTTDRKVKPKKTLHIPNDIFFSILSKLPIKSFKRFECVCKSWSLLSDDSYFMTMYRNYFLTKDHSYYDGTSVLVHKKNILSDGLYCVSGEKFDNRVKLDWPSLKMNGKYYDKGFNIIGSGSVHGTLCLSCSFQVNIILWNPSTTEFKVIPPSPNYCYCHRHREVSHLEFGYDCVKDDYKVMRHIAREQIWEIYSLRSNSWRKLDVDVHNEPMGSEQLYIDGLSHWMCKSKTHNEASLLSFDWSNEVFITTPIPSYINDEIFDYNAMWPYLMLLNGSIALILNYTKTSTCHILILGELSVKDSWTELFIVGPLPYLEYPIGAGKKGDILFLNKKGGLVLFDLNTQKIVELGILDGYDCKIVIHKENLLPFEDIFFFGF